MSTRFHLIGKSTTQAEMRTAFERQKPPEALSNLTESAKGFEADESLLLAVNAAMAVGAPLLLTGDPGTGKTQVAYWLAWKMGLVETGPPENRQFFRLTVQSSTTAEALTYRFDHVAYFHKAYERNFGNTAQGKEDGKVQSSETAVDKRSFIREGVLWNAIRSEKRAVVLIDEIDKAPRDFPNDLLHVMDQYEIDVPELPDDHPDRRVKLGEKPPPFIVVTSNSERRLPEPFLRRCVFHRLLLDMSVVRQAAHNRKGDSPNLTDGARDAALKRFEDLRGRELRKKPSTAELLVWLTLLSARGVKEHELTDVPLHQLPLLGALVKSGEDLDDLKSG